MSRRKKRREQEEAERIAEEGRRELEVQRLRRQEALSNLHDYTYLLTEEYKQELNKWMVDRTHTDTKPPWEDEDD